MGKRRYGHNAYYLDTIRHWWQYTLKTPKEYSREVIDLASYELEARLVRRRTPPWPLFMTVAEVKELLESGKLEEIIKDCGLPLGKKVLECVRAFLEEAEICDLQAPSDLSPKSP